MSLGKNQKCLSWQKEILGRKCVPVTLLCDLLGSPEVFTQDKVLPFPREDIYKVVASVDKYQDVPILHQ